MTTFLFRNLSLFGLIAIAGLTLFLHEGMANEFRIYSISSRIPMGDPGETKTRDYFFTLGSNAGARAGATIDVFRRMPTYDLSNERLYREVTYPIARLRIIHAEPQAAIGRLEKYYPASVTPNFSPPTIMVGDLVQLGH